MLQNLSALAAHAIDDKIVPTGAARLACIARVGRDNGLRQNLHTPINRFRWMMGCRINHATICAAQARCPTDKRAVGGMVACIAFMPRI